MSKATLTLIGMYNYDNSLFDNITLPEGIDKNTLVFEILKEAADFEVLYPQIEFLRVAINNFFAVHLRTFTKWIDALNIEYNPLENYDRKENWTDTNESENTSGSEAKSTGSSTNEDSVSAFDSATYQPDHKSVTSPNLTDTSNSTNDFASEAIHDGRIHGNIGVTTSQQMLQAELDIAKWNIYKNITELFLNEFCIMVY